MAVLKKQPQVGAGQIVVAQPKIQLPEPVVHPGTTPAPPPISVAPPPMSPTPGTNMPEPAAAPVVPGAVSEPAAHAPSPPPPAFAPAADSVPAASPPSPPPLPSAQDNSGDSTMSAPPPEPSSPSIVLPPVHSPAPIVAAKEPTRAVVILSPDINDEFDTGGKIELCVPTLLIGNITVTVSELGSNTFEVSSGGSSLGSLSSTTPLTLTTEVNSDQVKVTLFAHDSKVYAYATSSNATIPYSQTLDAADCDHISGIDLFVLPESTRTKTLLFVKDKWSSSVHEITELDNLHVDVSSNGVAYILIASIDSLGSLDVRINKKPATPPPTPVPKSAIAPKPTAPVAAPAAPRSVAAPAVSADPYAIVGPTAKTVVIPDAHSVTGLTSTSVSSTSSDRVDLSGLLFSGKKIDLTDNSKFEVVDKGKVVFSIAYSGNLLRLSRNGQNQDARVDITNKQTLAVGDKIISFSVEGIADGVSVSLTSVKDVEKPESAFVKYAKRLIPTPLGATGLLATAAVLSEGATGMLSNSTAYWNPVYSIVAGIGAAVAYFGVKLSEKPERKG